MKAITLLDVRCKRTKTGESVFVRLLPNSDQQMRSITRLQWLKEAAVLRDDMYFYVVRQLRQVLPDRVVTVEQATIHDFGRRVCRKCANPIFEVGMRYAVCLTHCLLRLYRKRIFIRANKASTIHFVPRVERQPSLG